MGRGRIVILYHLPGVPCLEERVVVMTVLALMARSCLDVVGGYPRVVSQSSQYALEVAREGPREFAF